MPTSTDGRFPPFRWRAAIALLLALAIGAGAARAGTLTGSVGAAPSTVNLTSEGATDWIHWGRTTTTAVDRKAGVTARSSPWIFW